MNILSDDDYINLFAKEYEQVPQISPDEAVCRAGRAIEAAVLEAQSEQKPVAWCFVQTGYTHYTDDKRDWYDAVGVEEVTPLYTASVVQPGMVLVPREPTEEMLAVIRNERGAYGTGESLYADLIAAAEGKE